MAARHGTRLAAHAVTLGQALPVDWDSLARTAAPQGASSAWRLQEPKPQQHTFGKQGCKRARRRSSTIKCRSGPSAGLSGRLRWAEDIRRRESQSESCRFEAQTLAAARCARLHGTRAEQALAPRLDADGRRCRWRSRQSRTLGTPAGTRHLLAGGAFRRRIGCRRRCVVGGMMAANHHVIAARSACAARPQPNRQDDDEHKDNQLESAGKHAQTPLNNRQSSRFSRNTVPPPLRGTGWSLAS